MASQTFFLLALTILARPTKKALILRYFYYKHGKIDSTVEQAGNICLLSNISLSSYHSGRRMMTVHMFTCMEEEKGQNNSSVIGTFLKKCLYSVNFPHNSDFLLDYNSD